ncbi:TnsA endonuclease N-terminal domain-containing protein [Tistrella mobilis]|uniref:TnsA endonuclease N-terminal domain-containing protein n=1 Tax=Tistrella mobilis TaxID=171437 RepID=UPI0035590373
MLDWHDAVSDIREQFPLGRDETQEIASRLGVGYPVDRHTRVPLVMTTDFLVDFSIDGSTRRVAYAVKPSKALTEARTAVRTVEKLEIERLYWLAKGVSWGIVTEGEISKPLVRNISWVHSYRDVEGYDNQPYPGYLAEKADLILMELPSWRDASLRQACQELDLRFVMQTGTARLLVRHLIACKRLVCDMTLPLDDSAPVSRFQVATAVQKVGRLG